ncbi:hypothetical protein L2E82_30779 [Cichorium intybus]|uniref:Uncharacterized protein n=1 Tax=Cichorium intybus TaxID=13427 RepID=A0ACB9D1T4_CICIN|nr:hypothetical protein L2E82_30779 [Cichorium intybus]
MVVRNIKVEQGYRMYDDHYTLADLVVVDAAVLFWEVPDLGSRVAVVEPSLFLLHRISPLLLNNGIVAEEVVGHSRSEWIGRLWCDTGVNSGIDGGVHDGMCVGAETAPPEALVLPK